MSSDFETDAWERFKALPPSEQQIIEAIKGVEGRQKLLQYELQVDIFELKKKYADSFNELYDRRKALITGATQPQTSELDAGEKALEKLLGKEFIPPNRSPLYSNGVANFWLAVLMNHPGLSMIIAERDQKALEHLIDIRYFYFGGLPPKSAQATTASYASATTSGDQKALPSYHESLDFVKQPFGFKLSFYFSQNEFFTNEVLEKTYYYKREEVNEEGELMYDKSAGCTIAWKAGKDLTTAQDDEDDEGASVSFFTFFSPKSLPSKAELDAMDDDAYGELLDDIDGDFECGEDIRDEVIPLALTYLLDPPALAEDGEEDEEDEEEEGED